MWQLGRLSVIGGLDYWNGLLEWTTGMDFDLFFFFFPPKWQSCFIHKRAELVIIFQLCFAGVIKYLSEWDSLHRVIEVSSLCCLCLRKL